MSYLRRFYLTHTSFLMIVAAFVAFRVMTLLLYRPGGYIYSWSEYEFFGDVASLSNQGYYPYLNLWMEHPPLLSWFTVIAYKLSLLAPPWYSNLLWLSLSFGLALLPFEVGNLVLIYAIVSSMVDRATGVTAAWIYSSLFLPVFFWTAGFDCYPLFFLLLSIYLAIKTRPGMAGIATGVGFMVKLIPGVAAPIILLTMAARSKTKAIVYAAAASATAIIIAVPFALANPTMFVASIRNMVTRPTWETVWALLEGYYGSAVLASPSSRLDPATAEFTNHPSTLPWVWISVAFAAVFILLLSRKIDWGQPRKIVAMAAIALNIFILYSKGYSPQFVVYLLAFVVILFPNLRGIVYCILLSAINIAEYPIALTAFVWLDWMVAGTVILRTVLLLFLTAEYLAIVFGGLYSYAARFAMPAVTSIVVLGLVGLAVPGSSTYFYRSIDRSMFREPIEFLRSQTPATVLLTNKDSLQDFYAVLKDRHNVLVTDNSGSVPDEELKSDVWLVDLGSSVDKERVPLARKWLAERGFPVSSFFLTNGHLMRYSMASPKRESANAQFGGVARLVSFGADSVVEPGNVLHVSLTWQAIEKLNRSYKVFVHVVDAEGHVVAQQDSEPDDSLRPTQSWVSGEEITDNHGILLPAELPVGSYRLLVGLYDSSSGTRLTTSAGSNYFELGTTTAKDRGVQGNSLTSGGR